MFIFLFLCYIGTLKNTAGQDIQPNFKVGEIRNEWYENKIHKMYFNLQIFAFKIEWN